MRVYFVLALAMSVATVPVIACDDAPEEASSSSSGTGGSGTGGSTSTGGTGGSAGGTTSGGAGGSTSSGSGGGGNDFWNGTTYDSNGSPNPSHGQHQAANNCMNCHDSGGNQWLFGGTVYQTGGSAAAAHVQVGVRVDGTLYTTYSGTNGNFWIADPGGSPSWAGAEARLRNANGETVMASAVTAACNNCHSGNSALIEP